MISVIFTVIIIIFCILYYHLSKKLNYFKDSEIPYAPGWPLFGNMAGMVFRRQHMSDTILQIYNMHKEAKYVGAFEFTKPIVLLRDPELIKFVAIKNFDSFPCRQAFVDDTIDPMFACNLFNINGEYWKEMRNLLSPTFTTNRMRIMHELMMRYAKNYVDHLAHQLTDDERQMVMTKDLFTKYTGDAIVSCLYGVNIDTLTDPDNFFYVLGRRGTKFDAIFTIKLLIARFYPKIIKWFGLKFIPDYVIEAFQNFIDETVKIRDEKGISRPDMIQLMMDARNKGSKYLKLNLMEMTSQAFTFFFGGFDTTSTQLCIVAHELALNSDVQEKLQEEIDEIMAKTEGNPTYEDIQGMLYADAVFSESMRRHSQASILDRVCVKDFELPPALPDGKAFTVKAGTKVWIPVVGVHMDPNIFENPEKFDPSRFYKTKVNANDGVHLGFGVGPRTCIGNRFTVLEAKIFLVHLLSKFNLRPNEKTCTPLKYDKSTYTINAEGGFWLTFESRNMNRN